jgi:hypothetical protein
MTPGQSLAPTGRKSSSLTLESFHVSVSQVLSYAPTYETGSVLDSPTPGAVFHKPTPTKHAVLARAPRIVGILTIEIELVTKPTT